MQHVIDFCSEIVENVESVIIGKREVIELVLVALLCDGHILLEDVPGTGKTMLARAIAISLGGTFKRLQCTPDLLPNDVTGVSVYNQQNSQFDFRPGPIFVNVLLVDEINRATPRTQSALLEAMQEQQVSVDGVTRLLARPFLILATQNPIEYEGTFPLPEAQLDRFLMRLKMGYPSPEAEKRILIHLQRRHPIVDLEPVRLENISTMERLIELQHEVWEIHIDDSLQEYIIRLIDATRHHPSLMLGGSPRASLAIFKTAQAYAAVRGREYVIPDDIKFLLPFTLSHRLILSPEAELKGITVHRVIQEVLESTPLKLEMKPTG